MRTARRSTVLAFALVAMGATTAPGTARAEESPNAAAAQALFDDAKALMQTNAFAAACPKLEESQRLQAAGGTLMFLALCREGEGKTATAWTLFNEVLSTARRDGRHDREKVAQDHIAALTVKLARVSVVVPDAALRPPELEIRRDDVVVPGALWGTAVPVDPGTHTMKATAPGMIPWETSIVASEGQTTASTVPTLVAAPVAAPPPTDLIGPVVPTPSSSGRGRTSRIVGITVGAAGVVLLGVGSYFGAAALTKKGDESSACSSHDMCGQSDVATSQTAVGDGNASTVLLAVGAAAVIGGGIVWLTAPSRGLQTASWTLVPLVSAGFDGVGIHGKW